MSLLADANDALRDLFRRLTSEGVAGGMAEATGGAPDPLDQLKKLAELREIDAITISEFEGAQGEVAREAGARRVDVAATGRAADAPPIAAGATACV